MTKKQKNYKQTTGDRIRATRARLGVSQVSLARMIGCSYMSVHRWENGVGAPGTLHAVVLDALHDVAEESPEIGPSLERTVGQRGLGYTVYTLLAKIHGEKKHA